MVGSYVFAGRLDALKVDFEAGKPPYSVPLSVIETIHRATAELMASGAARQAKKVADQAPTFSLKDAVGKPITSSDLLQKGPLGVTFYRGVWCPYCNMELQALEDAEPQIENREARWHVDRHFSPSPGQ